jgi:hypothetical protein
MDVGSVMDDLGTAVDLIDGLRIFPYWAGSVTAPAAIVGFPEGLAFDETYGRGSDSMSLPVVIVVGRVNARATRDRLGRYAAGSGAASVKATIEGYAATSYDSARVERVEFGTASIGGTEYLAATFFVDIIGSGA